MTTWGLFAYIYVLDLQMHSSGALSAFAAMGPVLHTCPVHVSSVHKMALPMCVRMHVYHDAQAHSAKRMECLLQEA